MIKLDGINPKERWGLIPQLKQENPLTPEMETNTMEIPGMVGAWDFGSEWKTRNFNIPFGKIEFDRMTMQRLMREFVVFLLDPYGKPREIKLSYDYDPDKYYLVKLNGSLNPDRLSVMSEFEVPMVAHNPYAQFIVPSNQISWDSDIPFMSDVLWGMDKTEFTINSPQTITLVYSGNVAMRAGFILKGSGTNVKISANGKTMTFGNMSNTTYEVDGQSYSIKKNGVDSLVTSEFIELIHGENKVTVSGSNLNLTFSEQLTYQFI